MFDYLGRFFTKPAHTMEGGMVGHEDKEFRIIFSALRRRLWILLLCILIPTAAVYGFIRFMPPVYEATVTLMVQPAQDQLNNEYSTLIAGERMAITYGQMGKTHAVLEAVIDQLQLKMKPEDLAKKIQINTITNTQLIEFTVQDTSAEQAALIANTTARVLSDHIQTLNRQKYTSSLEELQSKITDLTVQIDNAQIRRNNLNEQVKEQAAEIDRLNALMTQRQTYLLNLQQYHHSLQVTVAQATDKLHIVEPAKINRAVVGTLSKATVVLLFDRELLTGGDGYSSLPVGYQLLQSYGAMLTDESLLEKAIAQLNAEVSADDLAARMVIEVVSGTQLIKLHVRDADPTLAARLADTIAEIFVENIQAQLAAPYAQAQADLNRQIASASAEIDQISADLRTPMGQKVRFESELNNLDFLLVEYRGDLQVERQNLDNLSATASKAGGDLIITAEASAPTDPIDNRYLFFAAAGILGLLIGLAWIILLEKIRAPRFRTQQDVAEVLGIPAFASIGRARNKDVKNVLDLPNNELVANDFYILASKIHSMIQNQSLHSILVTSPDVADGKSFVTANLAAILTRFGLKVVVVDAHLRRPRQHEMFQLDQSEGLVTTLTSQTGSTSLQATHVPELKVLTSGESRDMPADVFNSPRLRKLFDDLKMDADLVLVDCPPLLPMADSTILSSNTDGVLLVLRADRTTSDEVKEALSNLDSCSSNLLGIILNDVQHHRSRQNYYSRYDGNGKSSLDQKSKPFPAALVSSLSRSPKNGAGKEHSLPIKAAQFQRFFRRSPSSASLVERFKRLGKLSRRHDV